MHWIVIAIVNLRKMHQKNFKKQLCQKVTICLYGQINFNLKMNCLMPVVDPME